MKEGINYPPIGQTYTHKDDIGLREDEYMDKGQFWSRMLLFIVIISLCLVCAVQIFQIKDLQTRLKGVENRVTIFIPNDIKALKKIEEEQNIILRQNITDIDILYARMDGKDPYFPEEE